jgi:hypothetical protein
MASHAGHPENKNCKALHQRQVIVFLLSADMVKN